MAEQHSGIVGFMEDVLLVLGYRKHPELMMYNHIKPGVLDTIY